MAAERRRMKKAYGCKYRTHTFRAFGSWEKKKKGKKKKGKEAARGGGAT